MSLYVGVTTVNKQPLNVMAPKCLNTLTNKVVLNKMTQELTPEIKKLLKWAPEHVDLKAISKINYPREDFPEAEYGELCTDEDCKAPFFSEAYLYNLLGKEDARTLLILLRKAFKSVNIEI